MLNRKKTNSVFFYGIVFLLAILFMSVGYATINTVTMEVKGSVLANQPSGVFIYDVEYVASSNSSADIQNYTNTTMHSIVTLSGSNSSSYITESVKIYNNTNKTYTFKEVLYDNDYYSNQGIIFEISNFNIDDKIAPNESKEIYITFKYKNNVVATSNQLDSYLNFKMVESVPMNVKVTNGSATYTGQKNSGNANIEVIEPTSNYTILYGTTEGDYSLNAIPGFIDVGVYTVYYKITADDYDTFKGELTITITKADVTLTEPTAKTLTYTGALQELINSGSTNDGTIKYKIGSGDYSTSIPKETNAGTYTVYYKVDADSNHNDFSEKSISVTISKANSVYSTEPANKTLTYNGLEQELITSGATSCGTIQYKLSGGSYSTVIPKATNIGTYTIYYKIIGDSNHNDLNEKFISTTIKAPIYSITYITGAMPYTPSSEKTSFNSMTDTITLDTPTSTGFVFKGWYDNSSCEGTAITQITQGTTGDVTLWAKWTFTGYKKVDSITDGSKYVLAPEISGKIVTILKDGTVWPEEGGTVNNMAVADIVKVNNQNYIVTSDSSTIWTIKKYSSLGYVIYDADNLTLFENADHCLRHNSNNINNKNVWYYSSSGKGFRNVYYNAAIDENDYYLAFNGTYFDTWRQKNVTYYVVAYIQTEINQSY